MAKKVILKIKRQDNPGAAPHWDEFELEWKPGMNVISAMMEIATNPVTRSGKLTTPIAYDSNCLEEVCGSCAMRINGHARMACSALVDKFEQPITVEPLSKFPVVRDLAVDRSVIFENLKRVVLKASDGAVRSKEAEEAPDKSLAEVDHGDDEPRRKAFPRTAIAAPVARTPSWTPANYPTSARSRLCTACGSHPAPT